MKLDKKHRVPESSLPVMVRSKVAQLGSSKAERASSWCVSVVVSLVLALALQ